MKSNFISILLLCAIVITACQSGDKPPQSAEEASQMIVGKKWIVKDVGYLVTSFRESKGKPFVYTMDWFSASASLGPEEKAIQDMFSKATLMLQENQNPNDGTGNIAQLDGLNLGQKQSYYFTSTQEENGFDRTVKLYVNCEDSTGALMQYPFTILEGSKNKLVLQSPVELNPKRLLLSLESQ